MRSLLRIRILFLVVLVFHSFDTLAQDNAEIDESSLSKKELRQLHREQRKAERKAKREERKRLREEKLERNSTETKVVISNEENASVPSNNPKRIERMSLEPKTAGNEVAETFDEPAEEYNSVEGSDENSESENDGPTEEGSNLRGYLIFGGLVLAALFFGKSDKGRTASGSRKPRQAPKPKKPQLSVYMCAACGLHVTQGKTPNNTKSCINGKTHRWLNVGPAGDINYGCLNCDIIVRMAKTPRNTKTCVGGKTHSWRKL